MKMGRFEKLFVNRPSRGRRVTEHAEKMLRLVGFAPAQSYLDFGCGNGAAAVYLASKLGLDVTGIDVDPEQIEAARAMSKETTKARFLTIDGTKLPFGDNEFDFVATYKVTHHIPDWHKALLQMLRVLRPNGYLIYTDFALPSWVASVGKRIVKSMGFPTADELDRFARENHLAPIHRAQTFYRYEVVWQKHADSSVALGSEIRA
jgi:ubiquinone/menaquinone biosynthesis C-methylase UbiE